MVNWGFIDSFLNGFGVKVIWNGVVNIENIMRFGSYKIVKKWFYLIRNRSIRGIKRVKMLGFVMFFFILFNFEKRRS